MRHTALQLAEDAAIDLFGFGVAIELDMRPKRSASLADAIVWSRDGRTRLAVVSVDRSVGRTELVRALREHLEALKVWGVQRHRFQAMDVGVPE